MILSNRLNTEQPVVSYGGYPKDGLAKTQGRHQKFQ